MNLLVTEENNEELLKYSLRLLKSIYRNYKLIYLAECHAYYGLITSSSRNSLFPSFHSFIFLIPYSFFLFLETQSENSSFPQEILQKYLGNAYSLLEFADELITGDGIFF